MSNTIFLAILSGLTWPDIVKRLNLEEREENIGDGYTDDGYPYSIIKREDKLYIILPEHPEEQCQEAAKRIIEKITGEERTVQVLGFRSSFCNYCLAPVSLPFKCKRCGGWYCKNHRLPEEHNCPGSERKVKTIIRKALIFEKKAKSKPITIYRSPCG